MTEPLGLRPYQLAAMAAFAAGPISLPDHSALRDMFARGYYDDIPVFTGPTPCQVFAHKSEIVSLNYADIIEAQWRGPDFTPAIDFPTVWTTSPGLMDAASVTTLDWAAPDVVADDTAGWTDGAFWEGPLGRPYRPYGGL